MPDDDMVHHPDFQDVGRLGEALGNAHVGFGGLRFTAGVIVQEDDGVGGADDGAAERFAGTAE